MHPYRQRSKQTRTSNLLMARRLRGERRYQARNIPRYAGIDLHRSSGGAAAQAATAAANLPRVMRALSGAKFSGAQFSCPAYLQAAVRK